MKKQTYDRAYPTIDLSEIKPSKFWEQSDERFNHKEEPKQETENLKNFKKLVSDEISPAMKDFIKEKQETTLEEAAREYYKRGQLGFEAAADTEEAFLRGAKWQQEQNKKMYSALETAISLLKQTTEFEVLDSWKDKVKELEQLIK
jgi:hypothetical protein